MRILLMICLLACCLCCRDRYEYIAVQADEGILIVEGVVNTAGVTELKLSRSTELSEVTRKPENGATVIIEGDDGTIFPLSALDSGRYHAEALSFSSENDYRLKITTAGNIEYVSDFRSPLQTQTIDSISYQIEDGGVRFFVNSSENLPGEYSFKYDLEETWQIASTFRTLLKYVVEGEGDGRRVRVDYFDPVNNTVNEAITTCWQSRVSTTINIGTTELQSSNHIQLPVKFLERNTIELGVMYSLFVKQYALSEEGYDFFRRMKKNTEEVGSIFDAQPSDISGNIRCLTDPSLGAIGFVEFTRVEEKRVFVKAEDLPGPVFDNGCEIYNGEGAPFPYPFENDTAILRYAYENLRILPTRFIEPSLGRLLFYFEKAECVDCTLLGTNIKPAFWP